MADLLLENCEGSFRWRITSILLVFAGVMVRGGEGGVHRVRRVYSRRGTSRRWVKDPDSLSPPSSGVGRNGNGERREGSGGEAKWRVSRASGQSVVHCRWYQ